MRTRVGIRVEVKKYEDETVKWARGFVTDLPRANWELTHHRVLSSSPSVEHQHGYLMFILIGVLQVSH